MHYLRGWGTCLGLALGMVSCGTSGGSSPGAGDAGPVIGTACVPSRENNSVFRSYSLGVIQIDPPVSVSGEPVCLVYHFLGFGTCPYGQDANGIAPAAATPCVRPNGQPITGEVPAQCTDRRPASTIFWSCRCANAQGSTADGASYCTCPSGTTCSPTYQSLGDGEDDESGSYCLSAGASFDAATACASSCDPTAHPCP
jgi:hypothetical protein